MSLWKKFTGLFIKKEEEEEEVKPKLKVKIFKEFLSLTEEERIQYISRAFSADYCVKSGLTSFKVTPPPNYFKPITELIHFKDKEEQDKFFNLI